jgi:hypothetical protein
VTITAKDISEETRVKYNSWYERPELRSIRGNSKNNFKWVVNNRGAIEALIRARFQKPDAGKSNKEKRFMSSLRGGLETLAHLLLAFDKNVFREFTRRIWLEGIEIQKIIDDEKGESNLTEEELINHVSYPDFVRKRNQKYEEWVKLREQYQNRPIKYDKGSSKRRMANLHHLLVAVNTYIPPLRRQWPKMKLHKGKEEPEDLTKQNYLWEKKPGEYHVVLNHDKIEAKRRAKNVPRQIMDLKDEIPGVTNGTKLNELLKLSFEDYPREWVFPGTDTDKALSFGGWDTMLTTMFKSVAKRPTQNVFRRAYVNYWHKKIQKKNVWEKIAYRMRHTWMVAVSKYMKDNIPAFLDIDEAPALPLKVEKRVIVPSPQEVEKEKAKKKAPFDPVTYSKLYREKNKAKVDKARVEYYEANRHKILRGKLLWHLNNNKIKKPQKSSKALYGLEYDEERGEWYSKFDTGELGEEDIPEMGERRKAPRPRPAAAKKKAVVKKVKDKVQKAEPVAAVRKSVRQRKTPKQFEN